MDVLAEQLAPLVEYLNGLTARAPLHTL